MKKIFTVMIIALLIFPMFSMFAPKAKADSAFFTDLVQLTSNPYDDRGAGWFPDSSKIVYSAFADSWYRNIWVMNSDGSNKEQLTFGSVVDEAPAYSPDGTKIVFMRYGLRGIDGSDLMMMNADGTNIQQLTSTGLHRGEPRWSHDGQRLAFYYGGAGTTTNEIHIMNADGTNEVAVASGTYPVMNPYWSPDDTKLVYTMDDGIWIVNTSPPYQKTRIFQTSLPTMYAVYSPDGNYIMYASGVYEYGQLQDLYLIDVSGNFIAQLTHDTKFGYLFDWSPDGEYIAYNSMSSGNYDVWRAKIQSDVHVLRAWKDNSSLGLENDRLYLHGLSETGNYRWFFDYLVYKDTGTTWYQPWGELAMLVYPNFQWKTVSTTNFEVNAFTETDKAYLQYSITSGNLKEELTYTIYPGEPYIYVTLSVTNVGSTTENTYAGVQFTTWIAGDHANDYFYVPGHGQGQFSGVGNVNFPDATETWIAEWDQSKGEGCGMLSTKSFTPSNMITEDFGIGEGFKFISDNFDLAPGQKSATYDCYFYFFTGTGWQETKNFYDAVTVLPPPLTVSISPLSASILLDQSVTFTSTVNGGTLPYNYQWYLDGSSVSPATLNSWTYTPSNTGIHYIYLKVTDAGNNTAQSETARVVVTTPYTPPVGGYSVSFGKQTFVKPLTLDFAIVAGLVLFLVTFKRRTKKERN